VDNSIIHCIDVFAIVVVDHVLLFDWIIKQENSDYKEVLLNLVKLETH